MNRILNKMAFLAPTIFWSIRSLKRTKKSSCSQRFLLKFWFYIFVSRKKIIWKKKKKNLWKQYKSEGILGVIIISFPRHKRRLAFINALQHVRSDSYQLHGASCTITLYFVRIIWASHLYGKELLIIPILQH